MNAKNTRDGKRKRVSRMGCVDTITWFRFPNQSMYVNRRCQVIFHYDSSKCVYGTVIRDDREEPYETIIRLDDGRFIRGVECQYSHLPIYTNGEQDD